MTLPYATALASDQPTEGGPAYRELYRIFHGAMAERRAGRDPDAFVRAQAGAGSGLRTVRDVSEAMSTGLDDAEYPMSAKERAQGQLLEAGNRLALGVPGSRSPLVPKALTWPAAVRAHLTQYETNAPAESRAIGRAASFPTYMAATASGNPLVAGAGAMGATGTEAAASLPPGPLNWKSLMSVATPALLSGVLTRNLAAAAHGFAGQHYPAAEGAELHLEQAGGEEAMRAKAAELTRQTPDVPPIMAELSPMFAKIGTRGGPLKVPAIQQDLVNAAHDAWLTARNAKIKAGQKYAVLNAPVTDARVDGLVRQPALQPLLERLKDAGALSERQVPGFGGLPEGAEPEPFTGRALNDVRLEVESQVKKLTGAIRRDPQRSDLVRQRAVLQNLSSGENGLRAVLRDNIPGFEKLQAEYGPYAQREIARRDIFKRLSGEYPSPAGPPQNALPPGRGTGLLKAPETSIKGQIAYHTKIGGVRGTKELQEIAQARALAPLMLQPADAVLHKIASGKLWPWFAGEGALPAAAVRALPSEAVGAAAQYGLPRLLQRDAAPEEQ